MISILKFWFGIVLAALGVSSCICILPLTMPASANAADP
jgi:cytochrome c biogenesis protein ResB